MTDSIRIRVTLPADLLDRLNRLADRRKKSLSLLMEELLGYALAQGSGLPETVYVSVSAPVSEVEVFRSKTDAVRHARGGTYAVVVPTELK